jgi:hypothetical protein
MNCAEAREMLTAYLEQRCPVDKLAEFDGHIEECADCSQQCLQAIRDANLAQAVVRTAYPEDRLQAKLDAVFKPTRLKPARITLVAVATAIALVVTGTWLIARWLQPNVTVVYQSGITWTGGSDRLPARKEFGIITVRQPGRPMAVGIVNPDGSWKTRPVGQGSHGAVFQWAERIGKQDDFESLRTQVMQYAGVPRALIICDGPDSTLRFDTARLRPINTLYATLGAAYDLSESLREHGFDHVDVQQTAPKSLEKLINYNLVIVVASNQSVEPRFAALLERYMYHGGGVVLVGGVPAYLCTPAEGPSGAVRGGPSAVTDLTAIEKWFGAYRYGNHEGGAAEVLIPRPFGVNTQWDTTFRKPGAAAVFAREVDHEFLPIVRWRSGGLFAFAHTYGLGRVYYQSVDREWRRGREQADYIETLFIGGCLWACGYIEDPSSSVSQ